MSTFEIDGWISKAKQQKLEKLLEAQLGVRCTYSRAVSASSSKATPQKTFRGRVRHPECQTSPNLHTVQVQGMMSSSSKL